MNKKTLVLGASLKPNRYSNMAIKRLVNHQVEVVAIGLRKGKVSGVPILVATTNDELYDFDLVNIHTVTLYLNPKRQVSYFDFIISLNPTRVIFNPGTENVVFFDLLTENNINFETACTLVLLGTDQY